MEQNRTPRKGSIVGYRFPLRESDTEPGPKVRPCLTIATFNQQGRPRCAVAYGTHINTTSNFGYQIDITDPDELQAARLIKPTRFVLARMRILPYGREYFSFGRFNTPVFGVISNKSKERLEKILDVIVRQDEDLAILKFDNATFQQSQAPRNPAMAMKGGQHEAHIATASARLRTEYNGRLSPEQKKAEMERMLKNRKKNMMVND